MRRFILMIVNDLFGLVELALLFRIVLRAFAANPVAPFVNLIYRFTDFLLGPVAFIFPNKVVFGTGIIDVVAITGMVIYAILFLVLLKIIKVLLVGPRAYS